MTLGPLIAMLRGESELEIIVADGGSTDGTAALAERLGVTVIACARGSYAVSLNSSRPISMRRISEVPAPIS